MRHDRDADVKRLREEAAAAQEAVRLREQELARMAALIEAGEHADGLTVIHRLKTQVRGPCGRLVRTAAVEHVSGISWSASLA